MRVLAFLCCMVVGCASAETEIFAQCDLEFILVPSVAAPGDSVSARGGPLTEIYDTIVSVGGWTATLSEVARDCQACDDCRALQDCLPCESCTNTCDETCATSCTESVTFVVPEFAEANTTVVILNTWGQSLPIDFDVVQAEPDPSSP